MFLITEEDVYEVTGRTIPLEEPNGERLDITIRRIESGSESRTQVRFSGSLLATRDIVGLDKGDLAMRAACRAVRLGEKAKVISVTTGNFAGLVGKKVPDDDIDSELAKLIVQFFKKQPAGARSLTLADLFISTDFFYRDIERRTQYLGNRDYIRWVRSEPGRFQITKEGFQMTEALAGSTNLAVTPKNKYFQLVRLPRGIKKPFVFVLMPFKDKGEFKQKVYREVIKPTVEKELGVTCVRSDEVPDPGVINNQIFTLIREAECIIVETTTRNPNVFYELGMAHAFNKEVFVFNRSSSERLPFDIANIRAAFYENDEDLRKKIVDNLKDHLPQ